jgi:sialate O-acetylesterase
VKRRALLAGAAALSASPSLATPTFAPVWTDHAVIQRDRPIMVEGNAAPGAQVEVVLGDQTRRVRAARDGHFSAEFTARAASDAPITLAASDSSGTTTVSDVVVGDVWLCSGQSNMEFPVQRALNGEAIAQASADHGLRLLMVPKATAGSPQAAFAAPVKWNKASARTVLQFSAACYFMARELRAKLGIPIGAIHSNWGGSQIRAWLTPEAGRKIYGAASMALLDRYPRDRLGAVTEFAPAWEAWWREEAHGQEPWKDPDALQWLPVPSIAPWPTWAGTPLAADPLGNVWFRRTITLTADQARAGGSLELGVIDDMDATWINGRPIGVTFGWDEERRYEVPARYLHEGANEIVFAASNSYGSGGFSSPPDKLAFVTARARMPLADGWRYAVGQAKDMPPRAPWDANAGIGVMHNRMIAPLGRFALAGAAWYQGESDVGIPGYRDRLRELFAGWRGQFGPDMRMLVVQLANYGPVAVEPGPSGWGELREDQRQAVLADADAALVTAIDIGERTDIHPANKALLGDRLARAALGEAMPMPRRALASDKGVEVVFSGIERGLRSWSADAVLGVELCGPAQDSCRFATAVVGENSLWIAGDGKPATRVRYAWADSPVVNAFDGRPMPLPGFEIPITP